MLNTTGISSAVWPLSDSVTIWIGSVDTPVQPSSFITNFTRLLIEKLLPVTVSGVVSATPATEKPAVGRGTVVSQLACDNAVAENTTMGVGTITTPKFTNS